MTVTHGGYVRKKANRTALQLANEVNLTRGDKNGYMSAKTRSKIKGNIDTLIFLSQLPEASTMHLNKAVGYQQRDCFLTFVTLTLPSKQMHDDNFIKRHLLDKFITILRKKYNVKLYLWVAEPQVNGNIHFHILIDKFIENVVEPKYSQVPLELTKDWNRILDLYGYVEPYSQKMQAQYAGGFVYNPAQTKETYVFSPSSGKYETTHEPVSYEVQLSAYAQGYATNWTQPNSVDIHRLKQVDNIKAYICKYMTKSDGSDKTKRPIDGRLWGCADQLRDVTSYEQPFDNDLQDAVLDLRDQDEKSVKITLITDHGSMDLQTYEDNELDGKVKVFATIYAYCQANFWRVVSPQFKMRFESYYRDVFKAVYSVSSVDSVEQSPCLYEIL